MTERTNSQVLGATLIGGMLGAGLALLFAPRSGKETRQMIGENASRAKAAAGEKVHQVSGRVHQGLEDAKELKDRLAEAAHHTGRKAKAEMSELKDQSANNKRRQSPVLSAWEEEV